MLGCQVIQICWCFVWTKLFLSPRSNKGQFCCWAATKGFWKCPSWIPELMNSWIEEWINDWTVLDQMTARPKRRGKWGGLRNHQVSEWVSFRFWTDTSSPTSYNFQRVTYWRFCTYNPFFLLVTDMYIEYDWLHWHFWEMNLDFNSSLSLNQHHQCPFSEGFFAASLNPVTTQSPWKVNPNAAKKNPWQNMLYVTPIFFTTGDDF